MCKAMKSTHKSIQFFPDGPWAASCLSSITTQRLNQWVKDHKEWTQNPYPTLPLYFTGCDHDRKTIWENNVSYVPAPWPLKFPSSMLQPTLLSSLTWFPHANQRLFSCLLVPLRHTSFMAQIRGSFPHHAESFQKAKCCRSDMRDVDSSIQLAGGQGESKAHPGISSQPNNPHGEARNQMLITNFSCKEQHKLYLLLLFLLKIELYICYLWFALNPCLSS